MLIFLDTEFTDFVDCELISIGMVSEDGQYEFYAERNDYTNSWCNHFVREAVLPHLGHTSGAACCRDELAGRLSAWFSTLPRQVKIACNSMHDKDLLWDALVEGLPKNLKSTTFDLRPLIDTTVYNKAVSKFHERPGQPWHHALHDAKAHRAGWMAWMAEKSRKSVGKQPFIKNDEYMARKYKNQREFREQVKAGLAKASDASMFHGMGKYSIVSFCGDEY